MRVRITQEQIQSQSSRGQWIIYISPLPNHLALSLTPQPTCTTTPFPTHIPSYLFRCHPFAGCCLKSMHRRTDFSMVMCWWWCYSRLEWCHVLPRVCHSLCVDEVLWTFGPLSNEELMFEVKGQGSRSNSPAVSQTHVFESEMFSKEDVWWMLDIDLLTSYPNICVIWTLSSFSDSGPSSIFHT